MDNITSRELPQDSSSCHLPQTSGSSRVQIKSETSAEPFTLLHSCNPFCERYTNTLDENKHFFPAMLLCCVVQDCSLFQGCACHLSTIGRYVFRVLTLCCLKLSNFAHLLLVFSVHQICCAVVLSWHALNHNCRKMGLGHIFDVMLLSSSFLCSTNISVYMLCPSMTVQHFLLQ